MRAKSRPQICGKADVEPVIGCGSKNVNVEHIRSLGALARERSFYVPADAIEEFRGEARLRRFAPHLYPLLPRRGGRYNVVVR